MALTYSQLVSLVRTWSNRDEEVVSDAIIQDCLRYAADKAYRTLRVPPLETVATYTKTDLESATTQGNGLVPSKTEIQIPVDLIEFIQIKEIDVNGQTTRVFNEKSDVRTFNDPYAEKYNVSAYWTRERSNIILSPGFGDAQVTGNPDAIELYYYRRLPALNATYAVTVLNYNAGLLTETDDTNESSLWLVTSGGTTTAYATQAEVPQGETGVQTYFIGNSVPNWLRDENERVLLNGALAELFAYVQDDVQAKKYMDLFYQEIKELNDEDKQRSASGGNVQINFNGRGLI